MATTSTNPFQKATEKNSLLSVTLTPEQRQVVEALRDHLGLKTNTAVVLTGLATLYEKHKRQLGSAAAAADTDTAADTPE